MRQWCYSGVTVGSHDRKQFANRTFKAKRIVLTVINGLKMRVSNISCGITVAPL
jgi:hypothetical protein